MKEYQKIEVQDLPFNPWECIGSNWLLVSAGGKKHRNTMTISWGAFGVHWNKPTVTVMIRPQRYTKGFVEKKEKFSISVMPNTKEMKKKLAYLGKVSGRDEDKVSKMDLHFNTVDKIPSLEEAEYVLNCQVLYRDQIEKSNFLDKSLAKENYPEKDYHYVYIGEVLSAYKVVDKTEDLNATKSNDSENSQKATVKKETEDVKKTEESNETVEE